MFKFKHTAKFYFGGSLIISSFIVGKITTAAFILNYHDSLMRWLSIFIYIISWPMLLIGVWWVGKEYAEEIKKYISYKFYHESVKQGTKMVVDRTKTETKRIHSVVKNKFKRKKEN